LKTTFNNVKRVVMRSRSARVTCLLRLVVIALLFVTTSGLSAAMAAPDDGDCIGCGCACTGSCDGSTCPPGPLCSDAPQCVSIEACWYIAGHV
jgi:hypothetical protein